MDNTKKFILINLGLLVLEVIWGTWQYNIAAQQPHSMAGLIWFFIPVIHAALCLVLALVFFLLGNREMAKNFAVLFLGILVIGFSTCLMMAA